MATVKQHSNPVLPHTLWQSLQDTALYLQQPVEQIHWVVAFSGGKDSSALAYAMANLPICLANVSLLHIHHGLQQEADEWAIHSRSFAQRLRFSFHTEKVKVNTCARVSIEASAREARYKALRDYCNTHNGVLLIAQHEDDQLETVLLQLKRGAGPKGLSGMAKRQRINNVLQVRPWLELPQQAIVDYIAQNKIPHINDPSNQDTQFDRNFLRNDILPLLTQRWSGMAKAVNRTASLCAQQNTLIEEQVTNWLNEQSLGLYSLPLQPLLELSKAWQAETLRGWIRTHTNAMPSHVQLTQFLDMLHSPQDKIPEVKFADVCLRRFSGEIYFVAQPEKELSSAQKLPQYIPLIKHTFSLDCFGFNIVFAKEQYSQSSCAKAPALKKLVELQVVENGSLEIAYITATERMLTGGNSTKSVKRVLKETQVPPWCRGNTLVLCCNGVAIAFFHAMGVTPIKNARQVNKESNLVSLVVSHRKELCRPV